MRRLLPFLIAAVAFTLLVSTSAADLPPVAPVVSVDSGVLAPVAPSTTTTTVTTPASTTTVTRTATAGTIDSAAPLPSFEEPISLLQKILGAGKSGQWWIVGAALASLLTWILRYLLSQPQMIPWFGTDRGGMVLALIIGLLSAIAATFVSGKPTVNTITDGLRLGITSIGTYVMTRKAIKPADQPKPKQPGIPKPLVDLDPPPPGSAVSSI